MSTAPRELQIGTLASPEILRSPQPVRLAFAREILDAGIDHVFVADHVSFHVGAGMDGLINAASLTALDPALRVCVGVYLLALRNPVTVARQLATLSETSPGQLIFGVGIGGEDRNEIAMCGIDPRTRGRRTDECLEVLNKLLLGEPVDHDGEFYRFERGWIEPRPEPRIPIVVGGRSAAAVERAGRHGDGWLGTWISPKRFEGVVEQLAPRFSADRPPLHGLQVWVGFDDDRERARDRLARGMEDFYKTPFAAFEKYSPYGRPEDVAAFLRPYRDAGCRLFNIMPLAASESAGIEGVAEVRRLLRED
ncbi:MAG: LLM class flavin-dependent oxidoreductase [Myxococcota bacterium]|jgi:alkanesulfonate monooxygenase SsuD/methylene tetrahydromethanopterin reductase-like flavin-dependent oxidoreductase (luciferase family)|nr:LLM class flavin-dependent oxidoreductase [Myxococcota bacterium]